MRKFLFVTIAGAMSVASLSVLASIKHATKPVNVKDSSVIHLYMPNTGPTSPPFVFNLVDKTENLNLSANKIGETPNKYDVYVGQSAHNVGQGTILVQKQNGGGTVCTINTDNNNGVLSISSYSNQTKQNVCQKVNKYKMNII